MTTTENKLHFIVVPIDAENFELRDDCLYYSAPSEQSAFDKAFQHLPLFTNDYKIVGTIHPENAGLKWSFDPEPYTETENVRDDSYFGFTERYKNYADGNKFCYTPQDSFLSKMKAESGLYFFNPLGEFCPSGHPDDNEACEEFQAWQEAEAKRITQKVVVLLEIKER